MRSLLQFANPFLKPVDTNLYPDYPLKVPHPLDFGTVKARLDAGKYTSNMEAFAKDMQQIFDNAFIYNAPGSTVHQWAVLLKVCCIPGICNLREQQILPTPVKLNLKLEKLQAVIDNP